MTLTAHKLSTRRIASIRSALMFLGVPARMLRPTKRKQAGSGSFWTRPGVNHLEILETAKHGHRRQIKKIHPDLPAGSTEKATQLNVVWKQVEAAFRRYGWTLGVCLVLCGCKSPKRTSHSPPMPPAVERVAVRQLVVAPPISPKVSLTWDYPPEQLSSVIFEFVSLTNLNGAWQFKTNVVATNTVTFSASKFSEFFTISRVIDIENPNNYIKQKGF